MTPKPQLFCFGQQQLDLSRPHVMGILNLTPDSFSDGGELLQAGKPDLSLVRQRALAMVAAGASLLDIGGESTRPGARVVSSQEELDRVLPVLDELRELDVVLSVDTSNPELIKVAAGHGAGLINDVRALTRPGALAAAAGSGLPVCLMHMQGQPDTMQNAPQYQDVIAEISAYLLQRVEACERAGISRDRILLDPGFGFGKTLQHNLTLLAQLQILQALQLPMLIGLSRKGMLGAITGKPAKDRMAAGLAAAVIAVMKGARIIRTHDVDATVDALKVCEQLQTIGQDH